MMVRFPIFRSLWLAVALGSLAVAAAISARVLVADPANPAAPAAGNDLKAALAAAIQPTVKQLDSEDLAARVKAVRLLGRLGPAARSAVGPLLHAARESAARPEVVKTLRRIGPAAMSDLMAALDDADPYFRLAALQALLRMDPPPVEPKLAAKLIELYNPDNPAELHIAAAQAVVMLGPLLRKQTPAQQLPLVSLMAAVLDKGAAGERSATAAAMVAFGKPIVPLLCDWLKGINAGEQQQFAAADVAGSLGPDGAATVPILMTWLDKDSWRRRRAAAEALGQMGPAAKPAVDKLITLAWKTELPATLPAPKADAPSATPGDTTEATGPVIAQQAAEQSLIRLGPLAAGAIPQLIEVMKNPESPRRMVAARTLAAIGPAAADQVPLLLQLLDDPTWPSPVPLITAIARSGEPGLQAALKMIVKPSDRQQLAGLGIIRQMVTDDAPAAASDAKSATRRAAAGCAAAAGLLNTEGIHINVRKACLATLLDAAEPAFANDSADPAAARTVIAALVKFIDDPAGPDEELQQKAFMAIGAIGGPASDVLVQRLGAKDVGVRRDAISALATMRSIAGLKPEPTVAALVARLGDENITMRLLAPVALARWGADAVAPTAAALSHSEPKVRAGAADAIGRLGAVAMKASPDVTDKLIALLADKDEGVRGTAAWAIGRLGSAVVDRPTVAAALQARFDDTKESAIVRGNSARSLAESTRPAATFVGRLGETLADPKLLDAAADSLGTIGAKVYGPVGEK